MWNRFREWVYNILSPCIHDVECMKRGTYAGWLPLAIMAGSAIAKKFMDTKASDSQGKEVKRAGEQNQKANFETQSDLFKNKEMGRGGVADFLASQMTGARALSPEVIASMKMARANPARMGATVDPTKGSGWGLASGVAGIGGDMATAYMKGKEGDGLDASQPTSLRPTEQTEFAAPGIKKFNPWLDR